MRVVIEIGKEMEEKLLACAERQGKAIGNLIEDMLKEMLVLVVREYGSGREAEAYNGRGREDEDTRNCGTIKRPFKTI